VVRPGGGSKARAVGGDWPPRRRGGSPDSPTCGSGAGPPADGVPGDLVELPACGGGTAIPTGPSRRRRPTPRTVVCDSFGGLRRPAPTGSRWTYRCASDIRLAVGLGRVGASFATLQPARRPGALRRMVPRHATRRRPSSASAVPAAGRRHARSPRRALTHLGPLVSPGSFVTSATTPPSRHAGGPRDRLPGRRATSLRDHPVDWTAVWWGSHPGLTDGQDRAAAYPADNDASMGVICCIGVRGVVRPGMAQARSG
jgi:hypothetical protein